MFTGLIESTGTILSVTPTEGATRITVAAPEITRKLRTGDSVAVSGVCLTALDISPAPTRPTSPPTSPPRPSPVPPSPASGPAAPSISSSPLPAGSPLGGHVVQGHVDGTGTLLALEALRPAHLHSTDWRLALSLSPELAADVVQQGSITIEGISLTVALLRPTSTGAEIEAAIIPHTYKSTSLRTLAPGDPVNIETDVLARYAPAGDSKAT